MPKKKLPVVEKKKGSEKDKSLPRVVVSPAKKNKQRQSSQQKINGKYSQELKKSSRKVSRRKGVAATEEIKNPFVTRPTLEEQMSITERHWLVWDYYKTGASIRQISEILKSQNVEGASVGQVHNDINEILNFANDQLGLSVDQMRTNFDAVLQDIQLTFSGYMKKKIEPNTGIGFKEKAEAAHLVRLTVLDRIKLHNVHKETKVKLSVDDELAKLLNLLPEELPEANVNEPAH